MSDKCFALIVCVAASFVWTEARVNIINTFRPMYVQYGDNLTLTCVSDSGRGNGAYRGLEWLQEIPDTGWEGRVIEPKVGGNVITRYLIEEPTEYEESTLIKKDITLNDRGMYQCRDLVQENSFALWVTVLYIQKVDEVAVPNESVDLYCTLLGFETNIPYMDYHWYYREQEIVTIDNKYDLVHREGVSQLTLNTPAQEDEGDYTCSFTLQTNLKPINFSATVHLDTTDLPAGSSNLVSSTYFTITLGTLVSIVTHLIQT